MSMALCGLLGLVNLKINQNFQVAEKPYITYHFGGDDLLHSNDEKNGVITVSSSAEFLTKLLSGEYTIDGRG